MSLRRLEKLERHCRSSEIMQFTIYKTDGEAFDLIAGNGYMFAAFHDIETPIDPTPRFFNGYTFEPGFRVRQIGMRKPGYNSAGATVLQMKPPSYLAFAGSFKSARDPTAELTLFESYIEDARKQFAGETELPGYAKSFVAFYDLGPHFMIVTQAQSSRILSKDFKFA